MPDAPASRLVRVLEVDRPALVLGSTQPASAVDDAAARVRGVDVVRRRSGGGAVLLVPDHVVWIDAVIPRGDPLWSDDVGRAFHWLGEAWVTALTALGVHGARVHRGALVCTRWSRQVCFGGVGPGEVVTEDGAKVVGMAQRRDRNGALFQCAVPLEWDPAAYVALLGLPGDAEEELAGAVHPLDGIEGESVVEAFLAALPVLRRSTRLLTR